MFFVGRGDEEGGREVGRLERGRRDERGGDGLRGGGGRQAQTSLCQVGPIMQPVSLILE